MHHLEEVEGMSLKAVQYCVFDEADQLFEMGFAEQLKIILAKLGDARQTLLFSATLPAALADFARAGLQNPAFVRLDADTKLSPDLQTYFAYVRCASLSWADRWPLENPSYFLVYHEDGRVYLAAQGVASEEGDLCRQEDKPAALLWLLQEVIPLDSPTLIFMATRHHVEFLHTLLAREGLKASCVYGQMDQVRLGRSCRCPACHAWALRIGCVVVVSL
jgi:ATP-dependent RNA helicase DDX54/DBP10